MKKKSYKRPIALLVAVIGAYHIVLFALQPTLPPVVKTEVAWGDMSSTLPSVLLRPLIDPKWCADTSESTEKAPQEKVPHAASTKRVRFEYRAEASNFINTGNSAKITMAQGSSLTIDNHNYPLQQIEFRKSDITGKINLYLIHRLKKEKSAIVAVPLKISDKANPAIDALWRYLPKQRGDHNSLDDFHLDIDHLLPRDHTYFRYPVSDTCGKETIILGLTSPVMISTTQLLKLDKVLNADSKAKAF